MNSQPIAAITGAGSGLGEAMALAFAGHGYDVAALDIDEPAAQATATAVEALGRAAIALKVDVADAASMNDAADAVESTLGPVTALCANVGVQQFGAIERLTPHDWQWVLSVNVGGPVNTVTAFLPSLRRARGSRHVLLTSSSGVFDAGPRLAAYAASKHAVVGFGEVLRLELASDDISVSILFPAGMATRHLESSTAARPAELGPSITLDDDIEALLANTNAGEAVVDPQYAIRNLLCDLHNGERYIFTHGNYRQSLVERNQVIVQAFDRQART
jgi:NAD(P)-dependent dehydrogenase (short-subunit alcohol dehydrogenase family)